MKIIEYKTATAESCAALDAAVNKMLVQGFQLHGNPYSSKSNSGSHEVAQAMVRHGLREHPEAHDIIPLTPVAP